MEKIKNVYFCNSKEYDEVVKCDIFDKEHYIFLGAVTTYSCGLALTTIGNNNYDYVPLWIMKAILYYLEKQRKKLGKKYMLPNRDYNFFIKMFGKKCLIKVMEIKPIIA